MNSREWKGWIILFAVVILIAGIFDVFFGFLGLSSRGVAWAPIVIGAFYIIAGIRGIHAGFVETVRSARQYLGVLLFVMVISIIISGVQIGIVSGVVDSLCQREGFSPDQCHFTLQLSLGAAIASLLFSTICCLCCVICAQKFHRALRSEAHDELHRPFITHTVTTNTFVIQPNAYTAASVPVSYN